MAHYVVLKNICTCRFISLSKSDPLVVLVLVMFDAFSLFVKLKNRCNKFKLITEIMGDVVGMMIQLV